MTQYKYQLDEKDIPRQWYNVQADLPASGGPLPPPLHPSTPPPTSPSAQRRWRPSSPWPSSSKR